MKVTQKIFWFLCFGLITSCINPVEFDTETPTGILVVNGGITTSHRPDIVSLSFAVEYDTQVFKPIVGAMVVISDDVGNMEELVDIGAGRYELQKTKVQGVVGRTYEVEIRLFNGKTYRSKPEKILPPIPLDSLSFTITREDDTNDAGRVTVRTLVNVSAHSTIPVTEEAAFLRWSWETIFAFYEPSSPFGYKICYIQDNIAPQSMPLLDGRLYDTPVKVQTELVRHTPDYTFNWRRSYYVWQHRISKEAYEYREKLLKITNQVGTIFDTPPAVVRGNIFNPKDASETVLGYFEASSVNTAVLFITRPDVVNYSNIPAPCTYTHPAGLSHDFCSDCLLLPNSTTQRPYYWP